MDLDESYFGMFFVTFTPFVADAIPVALASADVCVLPAILLVQNALANAGAIATVPACAHFTNSL